MHSHRDTQGHSYTLLYTHTQTHSHTYTHLYTLTHTYSYPSTHSHRDTGHTHTDSYRHAHVHLYPDMHTHTHIPTCTHPHTHTDTHMPWGLCLVTPLCSVGSKPVTQDDQVLGSLVQLFLEERSPVSHVLSPDHGCTPAE